jgi:hypothetical protein
VDALRALLPFILSFYNPLVLSLSKHPLSFFLYPYCPTLAGVARSSGPGVDFVILTSHPPCPLSEASIFLTKTMIVIHLNTLMFLRLSEKRFFSRRNLLQI